MRKYAYEKQALYSDMLKKSTSLLINTSPLPKSAVFLCGSYAYGYQTFYSDIDLLIVTKKPINPCIKRKLQLNARKYDISIRNAVTKRILSSRMSFYDLIQFSSAYFVCGDTSVAKYFIRSLNAVKKSINSSWLSHSYLLDLKNRGDINHISSTRFHRLKGGYGGFLDLQYSYLWLQLGIVRKLINPFLSLALIIYYHQLINYISLLRYFIQSRTNAPTDSTILLGYEAIDSDDKLLNAIETNLYFSPQKVIEKRHAVVNMRDALMNIVLK